MEENLNYLQNNYSQRIIDILEDPKLSYPEREFYAESPNWYTNNQFTKIIDTLIWLSYSDEIKINKLDEELQEYFDN